MLSFLNELFQHGQAFALTSTSLDGFFLQLSGLGSSAGIGSVHL